MGYIEQILSNPIGVIMTVLVVILALMELEKILKWIKGKFEGYHKIKTTDEDFHKKVDNLAVAHQENVKLLQKIDESVDKINERFNAVEKERKLDTQATLRATLYHLYEDLKDEETLTPTQYEVFHDAAQRYINAGGNSVFKNKIIPFMESKWLGDTVVE